MTRSTSKRRTMSTSILVVGIAFLAILAAGAMWAYERSETRLVVGQFAVSALDLSPDGRLLAAGYKDGVLEVRNAQNTGEVLWRERNAASVARQAFFFEVLEQASATRQEEPQEEPAKRAAPRTLPDYQAPLEPEIREQRQPAQQTVPQPPQIQEQTQIQEPLEIPEPASISSPHGLAPGLYLLVAKADGFLEIRDAETGDRSMSKTDFPRSIFAPSLARAEDGTLWVVGRNSREGPFIMRFPANQGTIEFIDPGNLNASSQDVPINFFDQNAQSVQAEAFFDQAPLMEFGFVDRERAELISSSEFDALLTLIPGSESSWVLDAYQTDTVLGIANYGFALSLPGDKTWSVFSSLNPMETDLIETLPVPITLEGHDGAVRAISFAPEKPVIATGGDDRKILLWRQTEGGNWSSTLAGRHDAPVLTIGFSPDGERFVTGAADGSVKLWQWEDDRGWVGTLLDGHRDAITRARFLPDGQSLVTSSHDATLRVWQRGEDQDTWDSVLLEGHDGAVTDVASTSQGDRLISSSVDGTARIWSQDGEIWSSRVLDAPSDPQLTAIFSPEGDIAATVSATGQARPYEDGALTPGDIYTFPGATSDFTFARIMPSGNMIVTLNAVGVAEIWDEGSGETFEGLTVDMGDTYATAMDVSSTEEVFAIGDANGQVTIWEGDANEISRATLKRPCADQLGHQAMLARNQADDTPSALWLMSRSAGVCSLSFNEDLSSHILPWSETPAAAGFLLDASREAPDRVLVGFETGGADLVDLRTGEAIASFGGHRDAVRHVVLVQTEAGYRAALGSEDGVVQVIELPIAGAPYLARAGLATERAASAVESSRRGLLDNLFPGTARQDTSEENILAAYRPVADTPENDPAGEAEAEFAAEIAEEDAGDVAEDDFVEQEILPDTVVDERETEFESVRRIEFQSGSLQMPSPGQWFEYDSDGVAQYRYEETAREYPVIYLGDLDRAVQLEIDLSAQEVRFGETGGPTRPQWAITRVEQSVEPGIRDAPKALRLQGITGLNVQRVQWAEGALQQTGPQTWVELGPRGEERFTFEEAMRDEWSVYLLDRSRDLRLQIDIHREMISFSDSGTSKTDLYTILEAQRR